ncbi:S9 family peptidase [Kineobactrum salinum]|uniref:S9 family peptidase n=2 Tax=Kineobactrum salinum TaxID=2708301 RepID=A0A6C0U619_9GAMM|nr:S9 family peptidase [Kineobactrum salinum]
MLVATAACEPPPIAEPIAKATAEEPASKPEQEADPYRWLEQVESEKALSWAREQNEVSLARLAGDPRYEPVREAAERILTAADRIPYGGIYGDSVRNFWQDDEHVRGIWRQTSLASYRGEEPEWTTLLDLDELAEREGENWVWKGATCLPPAYQRCLLQLSRGGADAVVVREFDLARGEFIADGFVLEEEKQNLSWIDADRLLVASPLAGGSKNTSGYARSVRLWQRGTPLEEARTLFTSEATDAMTFGVAEHRPEGRELFILRMPDFFKETLYHIGADGDLTELPLPEDVNFQGLIDGQLIALLRSDWTRSGPESAAATLPAGSVVSIPLQQLREGDVRTVQLIAEASKTIAIEGAAITQDALYLSLLDNVRGRLLRARYKDGRWHSSPVELPATGSVDVVSSNAFSPTLLARFETFLEPDTLYAVAGDRAESIKTMPARFDAEPFTVEQRFATSDDGTQIPYFLVRAKNASTSGQTPTILYGYGGFEISLTPSYVSPLAIEWLQRGGAYAIANIRGGGEFGPRWHQAALRENRPLAFQDFAAVARHLIDSGLTSAPRLGIYGGSNGGLLTTATMVRNPELFGAVVSAVPLIDMLNYHTLLAGASWIGEYGNPGIPAEREFIARYSPYQRVSAEVDYPPLFLTTSTRDDRVHPGHARKMAARMQEQGHEVLYYENIEGGHAAAADLKQRAVRDALVVVWFLQQLKDSPAP